MRVFIGNILKYLAMPFAAIAAALIVLASLIINGEEKTAERVDTLRRMVNNLREGNNN